MKRISNTVAKGLVIGLLVVVMLSATGAWATPTTPEQARGVVQNWLGKEAAPMGSPLGGQIREVQTFTDSDGNPAYYVVCLNPSGLVLVSADDLVEPIIGFVSGATSYDPASRLGALVSRDIPGRVLQARTASSQLMQLGTALTPQASAATTPRPRTSGPCWRPTAPP